MPLGDWFPLPMGFQYFGMLILFIAAKLSSIIMEDRTRRTLLRIGVAPISHFNYLFQNLLAYSLILVGLSGVVVVIGIAVHGQALIAPGLLFIIFACFSLTAIGFSLAWYSLFRNKEAAIIIIVWVITIMAMLGGLMWPIQAMPILFQQLAMLLPTYWLAEALLLLATGASFSTLILPMAIMSMYSIAFVLLGSMRRLT